MMSVGFRSCAWVVSVCFAIAATSWADEAALEKLSSQLPSPDLTGLESVVAEQLQEVKQQIVLAHERNPMSGQELGEAVGILGQHYHAYQMIASAQSCYELARERAPEDFRWPYLLGYLAQNQGNLDVAGDLYKDALLLDSNVAPAWIRLGQVELDRGDLDAAERSYRRSIQVNEVTAAGKAGLGKTLAAQHRFQEAASAVEEALNLAPEASRLYYPLAQIYRQLGEEGKAEQAFLLVGKIGVRPADPLIDGLVGLKTGERSFLLTGRLAFNAGDFQAAATAFGRAVDAAPNSIRAKINLAAALQPLGEIARAREVLKEALALGPGNSTAWFNLGQIFTKEADFAGAAEAFREAVRYTPNDVDAMFGLAESLYREGNSADALIAYRRTAELLPTATQAHLGIAQSLADLGELTGALDRLEQASQALPSSGALQHALARFLAASPDPKLRDGDRAIELALGVYQSRPTWRHGETVALALAEADRCQEGAEWLAEVLLQRDDIPAEDADALAARQKRYAQGVPCTDRVGK